MLGKVACRAVAWGQSTISEWQEAHPLIAKTRDGQQLASRYTAETKPQSARVELLWSSWLWGEETLHSRHQVQTGT